MSTKKHFQKYTNAYAKLMSKKGFYKYKNLLEFHKKALKNKKIILDSGCGPGELSLELLKNCSEIHAIDQNPEALNVLKRRARDNKKLVTKCKDLHMLDYPENYFDGISSMLVLPFIKKPLEYIKEHVRVLKPGGIFVISGPDKKTREKHDSIIENFNKDFQKRGVWKNLKKDAETLYEYARKNKKEIIVNWFSIKEVSNILKDNKLKIIKATHNPFYFGTGYAIIAKK